MKTILFVHQSAELYGSDRVLLDIVLGLDRTRWLPVVVLPGPGPLLERLRGAGVECHIQEVGKVHRADLSPWRLVHLALSLGRGVLALDRLLKGRIVHLVHTNTLAALAGALWARWRGVSHVWHVHETVLHPRLASFGYPLLVRLLADRVVCNSDFTRKWLAGRQPALASRASVICNDYQRVSGSASRAEIRAQLGIWTSVLVIGLVGRINPNKGHAILLAAAERLAEAGFTDFLLLFVGSAYPGQERFLTELQARIERSPVAGRVRVQGFCEDVGALWEAIDVAVVPSVETEAFGRVALEAMAAGRPVVASDLGGLKEVVEPGITGYLVPPADPHALAEALRPLMQDAELRSSLGRMGQQRQEEKFSLWAQQRAFAALYDTVCEVGSQGGQVAPV